MISPSNTDAAVSGNFIFFDKTPVKLFQKIKVLSSAAVTS